MRIGIDVMHPHPCTQTAKVTGQRQDRELLVPFLPVGAIGRRVLADHQQFAHARLHQLFRLAQHRAGGARCQLSPHVGDDAELAGVIAALGNLEIAVVAWCQLYARSGQQVDERIGIGRHGLVYRIQHLFVLMRAGHRQNAGMRAGDVVGLCPQTAGHDHPAILGQCFANGLKAFRLGRIQKPAGVHDHCIGPCVIRADPVAFGAQPRQNPFAVHQRLGTPQRHHADGRLARTGRIGKPRGGRKVGAKGGRVLGHGRHILRCIRLGKPGSSGRPASSPKALP